jgi:nitrogen fixation protein NifB
MAVALMRPGDAVHRVTEVMKLYPTLTVAGVAGPGDALATDHALAALGAVHERYPGLIKCLSTNGLRLPERIDDVIKAGVTTLSVTVNAVDARVLARMNDGVFLGGKYRRDRDAQQTLIDNQLKGIALAAAAGIAVKVNSVYVPGINASHIPDVAGAAASQGAILFNIIPLMPAGKLRGERAPTREEMRTMQREAEKYLPVSKRCRRCRADAAGTLA